MLSKTLLLTSLVATSALAAPSNFSKRDIPSTGGKSIIDVIDYWRNAYNLNNLDWSDQLAANAQKTGDDNGGEYYSVATSQSPSLFAFPLDSSDSLIPFFTLLLFLSHLTFRCYREPRAKPRFLRSSHYSWCRRCWSLWKRFRWTNSIRSILR